MKEQKNNIRNNMDLKNIKKFIELAKEENVSELKYESKDLKISVNFNSAVATVQPQYQQINSAKVAAPAQSSDNNKEINDGFHVITSPFVGTFYTSSSPEKPAYTNVGSKVTKGTTLCILEAMKIMNEIESDVAGEIVEVCVENESLVEFGQALFKVRV
jgi:acetyl-CoA carboxylase biotin carboxyl carrier protein